MADNDNVNKGNALDQEIAAFEGVHAVSSGIKTNEDNSKTTNDGKDIQQTGQNDVKGTEKTGQDKSSQVAEDKGADNKDAVKDKGKEVNIQAFDKILNPSKDFIKSKDKVVDDKTKVEDSQITTTDEGKPVRNLEGFGEQEKVWLKRMPFEGYEYFSKVLKDKRALEEEHKTKSKTYEDKIKQLETGKQVLPENYYEHENAFVLSPEFSNLQTYVQTAKAVENHWAEQLNKFKQGETWTTLINDPKTGELVLGEEREYNAADEVYLLKQLNGASQQFAKWQNDATKFIEGYKETHKTYISRINENREKMLPVFKDKESIEYKTYEAIKPTVEKWGISKNNPAFDFLAQAVALNLVFRDALTSMIAEQQKTNSIKDEQRKAGPTMNNLSGGSSNSNTRNTKEVSIADFNRIISPGIQV